MQVEQEEVAMSTKEKNLSEKKEHVELVEGRERTRERASFIPRTTIYETEKEIVLLADLPGVDENHLDVSLEKNVLNIFGEVPQDENVNLIYSEYPVGNYERNFTISEEVDRNNITASVKDGILRLTLPKLPEVQARKIKITAG
jgi:HSP20 family molecular chaperone IbpA